MKKILYLILFFNFIMNNTIIHAQNGIATVDTRILLMLHPLMKDFDYSIGRFYRETIKDKLSRDIWAEIDKANKKLEPERKKLTKEKNDLLDLKTSISNQISKLEKGFEPNEINKVVQGKKELEKTLKYLQTRSITTKDEKDNNESNILEIKKQISELNKILGESNNEESRVINKQKIEKLKKELNTINENINAVELKQIKLEEQAVASVYLTSDETNERIEQAKKDIFDLINKSAKIGKYSLVIDTTFAMQSIQRKRRNNTISVVEDSPDTVSATLFHFFTNFEEDPELEKQLNLPPDLAKMHLVAGKTIGMQSNLKQYLEFRNYLPEKVSNFTNGNIFLMGGADITTYVARELFNNYKIPDATKEMLIRTIKDYINFETEPFIREIKY